VGYGSFVFQIAMLLFNNRSISLLDCEIADFMLQISYLKTSNISQPY